MVDTPIPPMASTCAISILHREHVDAIQRMDAAQIRAVARLIEAADDSGLSPVAALKRNLCVEAPALASLIPPAIPQWWCGFD